MIADIISIVTGMFSIALSIYAIHFAKRESIISQKNYDATAELLQTIEKNRIEQST